MRSIQTPSATNTRGDEPDIASPRSGPQPQAERLSPLKAKQSIWTLFGVAGLIGINLALSGFWVYQAQMLLYRERDYRGFPIGTTDTFAWAFVSSQIIVLAWSVRNVRHRHVARSLIAPTLIAANGLAISVGAAPFLWEYFRINFGHFDVSVFLVSHTIFSFAFLLSLFLSTRLLVWILQCSMVPILLSFKNRKKRTSFERNRAIPERSISIEDDKPDLSNRFSMSELFLGVGFVAITMSGVRMLLDLENSFDTYRFYVLYGIAASNGLPVLAVYSSAWKVYSKLIAVFVLFSLSVLVEAWLRGFFPRNGSPILMTSLPNLMIWQTVVFGSVAINHFLFCRAKALHSRMASSLQ